MGAGDLLIGERMHPHCLERPIAIAAAGLLAAAVAPFS